MFDFCKFYQSVIISTREKHQTEAHVIEGVLKGKQNLKLTTATSDENAGFESTQSKLCRTDMYFVAEHLILIYPLTSDSECAEIIFRKRPQAHGENCCICGKSE
uniref:Uncharacterized protein n=1 Tax=Glossina palpalis gambiensis TaxID=67801 RepID=A0A1B0BXC3_9MUSC